MAARLRILIVEDAPNDAELALRQLTRAGIVFDAHRVETASEYRRELEKFKPQVILSDFTMPNFDGTEALAIAREQFPDIPFIFVSGSIGEEDAIRALKQGANDYVMKTNLVRLPAAVERAIQEQRERTARRETEYALRASELRKSAIFEAALDCIVTIDAQGHVIEFNPAAEKTFGYARDEVLGKELAELIVPPASRDAHRRGLKHYHATGEGPILGRQIEVSAVRKDGGQLPVELTVVPIPLPDQTLFSAHIRDITERKRNEEALREGEYRLDLALEASGLATWEWDLTTGKVRFSRHWWPILGYQPDDIALRIETWENLTHPDDLARVKAALAKIVRGSVSVLDVEYRIQAKTGEWRWIRSVGRVVERDAADRVVRVTGTHGDITERKLGEQLLRESEEKYRGLIEQASDGIFVSDAEGTLLLANSRWCELLGYDKDQTAGMNARETYLEEERETHAKHLKRVAAGQTLRFERMVKRRNGSTFPAEISLKMLDSGIIQGIFHDITERKEQEQKIARLSRIHAVLSGINSAIVRIRDRQELLNEVCRVAAMHGAFRMAWFGLLNHATGEMDAVASAGFDASFLEKLMHAAPKGAFGPGGVGTRAFKERRAFIDNNIMANPDLNIVRREAVNRGCRSVIGLPLSADGVTVGSFILYAEEKDFFDEEELKLLNELAGDISFGLEFIAKEEKVDYLAYYDVLTGLPNRSLLFDRLTHQLGTAERDGLNVALVLMDLDRFRLVNDTLGRQAGDALLNSVAQRIKNTLRDQDTVARVGADGFAVAISSTWKMADIAHILEARNDALFGQPFVLGGEELRVSATAGIAVFPADGDNPETLFANAEAALKKAKSGGDRFLFYGPEMNARVADSLRLENRLRRALDNGEMVLWYQPKVSVKTRKITGFEALMRWQDPETGVVPPAQFIPLMEQTGLILEAGRWALAQVARDCKLWAAEGLKPLRIAVNVSPIQLRQKNFVDTVIDATQKAEEAGASLDLEITESVIMENVESIVPILQTVRGLGVEIAVDDFGTGYSSLAYIARLPIHDLKIDRSFVVGMTDSRDSLAIVRSVISLAHSLRLTVVAEGVETEEQAALLLELGCDQMQGYLISRPVPPAEVPEFIRRQNSPAPDNSTSQVSPNATKA